MIPSHVSIDLQLLVDFIQVLRFFRRDHRIIVKMQIGCITFITCLSNFILQLSSFILESLWLFVDAWGEVQAHGTQWQSSPLTSEGPGFHSQVALSGQGLFLVKSPRNVSTLAPRSRHPWTAQIAKDKGEGVSQREAFLFCVLNQSQNHFPATRSWGMGNTCL